MYDGLCQHASFAYKFTGKERDAESVLDYFDARHYGSSLGRFMQTDPMGGKTEDPQRLNRYVYVRNNPLTFTDPSGMNFGLPCKGDSGSCHNGLQGSWVWNSDQGTFVFVPVSIGNQNGQLQDVSANKTGTYTANVGKDGVAFSQNGGKPSIGVFLNGTAWTYIQGSGDLAGFSFTFTNSKTEANQTAAGTFTFAGTPDQAGAVLQKAGFRYYNVGENPGMNEYRSPGSFWTGADSGHFNMYRINLEPWLGVPQAQGDMHFGEHNPFSNEVGLALHCAPNSVGGDGACQ